jgi:hypothetical protein
MVAVLLSGLGTQSLSLAAPPKKPAAGNKGSSKGAAQKSNPVTGAQKNLFDANNQLGFAKLRLQQAIRTASQTRLDVQKEHDASPGLQTARRLHNEHQQEMEAEKKAIREELAFNSSYQEAMRKKEESKQKLAGMSAPESAEGKAAFAAFQEASKQVRDLENEAFNRNTKVKTMLADAAVEEEEIRDLLKGRNDAIASDSRLSRVKEEIVQSKMAVALAEQQVMAANQRLAVAQQQYAQQMAAKAAANNKNKSSKKKPPKKR